MFDLIPSVIRIPHPVSKLISLLPAYPGSMIFSGVLNLTLAQKLSADLGNQVRGKRLKIHVTDARATFCFLFDGASFKACSSMGMFDLTIRASAQDFLLLATQKEDADTLFFNRRLVMEGDTDLGLLIKNTLDTLPPLFAARL